MKFGTPSPCSESTDPQSPSANSLGSVPTNLLDLTVCLLVLFPSPLTLFDMTKGLPHLIEKHLLWHGVCTESDSWALKQPLCLGICFSLDWFPDQMWPEPHSSAWHFSCLRKCLSGKTVSWCHFSWSEVAMSVVGKISLGSGDLWHVWNNLIQTNLVLLQWNLHHLLLKVINSCWLISQISSYSGEKSLR